MSAGLPIARSQLRPVSLAARPRARRTTVRLWLPLSALWIVLAPFALLLAPLLRLAPQTRGARPFRTAFAVGAALFALSGTVVEVTSHAVLIRIRIF